MIKETKIKEKLEKFLNRKPTANEILNGYKDQNILNSIMLEEIDLLKEEIIKLKTQKMV